MDVLKAPEIVAVVLLVRVGITLGVFPEAVVVGVFVFGVPDVVMVGEGVRVFVGVGRST